MGSISSIFVYGTLKRGECRAKCWPHSPTEVVPASTFGTLFDLGRYPALLEGDDRVLGELWSFAADDIPDTLRVLDKIECYGQQEVDLYVRRVITCSTSSDKLVNAYCYFLADETAVTSSQRIAPSPTGFCEWLSGDKPRESFRQQPQ